MVPLQCHRTVHLSIPLRRVIGWKSRVMALTEVDAGGSSGYGTSCEALQDMRVAVVPVGYAHGFDRGLSNFGRVS